MRDNKVVSRIPNGMPELGKKQIDERQFNTILQKRKNGEAMSDSERSKLLLEITRRTIVLPTRQNFMVNFFDDSLS